jgi:hypothetical protein
MPFTALALDIRGKGREKPEGLTGPMLDRLTSIEKKMMLERYGTYPEGHPVTKYVRSLKPASSNPDITVYVTSRWEDKNAAALPDGTVFISDRMIDFCRYEEELEFALQHEITHIKRGHAERGLEEKYMLGKLGRARLQEYEADLADMLKDEEAAVNPSGGIVFLERLAKEDEDTDMVHGSTYTRLIGVGYAARLVDMDALGSDLSEIPGSIKQSLQGSRDDWLVLDVYSESTFEDMKEAAKRAGFITSLNCIPRPYNVRRDPDPTISKSQRDELQDILLSNIRKEIMRQYPGCSEDAADVMLAFVVTNMDRFSELPGALLDKTLRTLRTSKVVFTEFPAMLLELPDKLPMKVRREAVGRTFSEALKAIAGKEPESAYAHASELLSGLKRACPAPLESTYEQDRLARLIMLAYPHDKTKLEDYLEKIADDGLDVTGSVFLAMCEHFNLPQEEQLALRSKLFQEPDQNGLYTLGQAERAVALVKYPVDEEKYPNDEYLEESRFLDLANDLMAIMAPSDVSDFIGVLDAYVPAKVIHGPKYGTTVEAVEEARKTGILALDRLIDECPQVLKKELLRHLRTNRLTNQEAIGIMKALDVGLDTGIMAFMVFGLCERRFSREEFLDLFSSLNPGCLPFVVYSEARRLGKRKAVEYLGFVYHELLHSRTLMDTISTGTERILKTTSIRQVSLSDIARHMLDTHKFNMRSEEDLDGLLTVSCYIEDPNLKLRLQKAVLKKLVPLLDKKKAHALLFSDPRVADYAAVDAREAFLDKTVTGPRQLEEIKNDLVKRFSEIDSRAAGSAVLGEAIVESLMKDKERMFKALIMTGKTDGPLREYLSEVFLSFYLQEKNKGTDFGEGFAKEFLQTTTSTEILAVGVPDVESLLYELDFESRNVLCQQLLIGDGGILLDREVRERTMKWFFRNFIKEPQSEDERKVYELLELAFDAVAANAEVPTLYFLLHPIMVERILGKPKKRTHWKSVLKKARERVVKKAARTEEDEYYFNDDLEGISHTLQEIFSGHQDPESIDLDRGEEERRDSREYKLAKLNQLCREYVHEIPETTLDLSVMDFVKQLSSKLGAPGVRFLQCLGIYVDLPSGLRKEFDDIYDNVKGQLKLSAFHTMEKNWEGTLDGELERFGSRIGGGSLVTVYESVVDGKPCVLKVANPNVSYRAGRVCDNLRSIFESDEKLGRAVPLIESIRTWIETDISMQSQDLKQAFAEQNHGFNPNNGSYEMMVPETVDTSGKHTIEELVEGNNLTNWEALEPKHDMKAIVSLVVKNAIHQVSNGLVHADMHVGNIRVREDRKVAWLDNNYLILLSGTDKEFLGSLVLLASDRPGLAKAVGDYLCSFEENSHIDQAAFTKSLEEILLQNGSRDVASFVSDIVAVLSKEDGVIPLNVMLLTKNALALERMAKRAGFKNAAEAYYS